MFFKKDELSKYQFLSVLEFILVLILLFASVVFSFIYLPQLFKQILPTYTTFFDSHYFGIFVFIFEGMLLFSIIYFFACFRKHKSIKEGLFFYPKSRKTILISVLIGMITPIVTLPILFKLAPGHFFAMDMAKTKDGLIYLFICGLLAPLFEEMFYRGFIFPFFQSKLNSFWAVIITAVFFGISHYANVGNAYLLVSVFIFYGFVLTLLRYFTNSMIPPMVTHFTHNFTLIIGFLIATKFKLFH